MNMQRNILIAALAVITYLMVLQWNKDYGDPVIAEPVANNTTQQQPAADVPALATPQLPDSSTSTDDVPQMDDIVGEETPSLLPSTSSAASHLIQIETDTQLMSIDLRGGDIVSLTLPQYPVHHQRPDIPFQLLEQSNQRTYVAESGLIGRDGPYDRNRLYQSEQSSYRLADGSDTLTVDLQLQDDNGVTYTKRFTFTRGDYLVKVDYLIDNQSSESWFGGLFGQIKRDGSGDPSSSTATGMATFLGAAYWSADGSYEKLKPKDMDKSNLKENLTGGWVAWLQHYFVTAWIPPADTPNTLATRTDRQGNYLVSFVSPPVTVEAGEQTVVSAEFYAGPKAQNRLKEISPGLELTVDYGFLWFIAQPLYWVLSMIHSIVGNWGWSIILLTVLIKLVFFPLSATSYRSMANMRRVAPKMQALREQFGDDRQKLSQGMMELYKKEKINPLGGCLPILVQMPVFIALYWTLMESVEIRQAPWIGWITDLSLKDPFFILPILMGVSMFIQQQLNPTPPDPMQAKVMKMLPIVFTFFFLWFPAGLVLYWVVNNILSIAQQWYITRKIERAAEKD